MFALRRIALALLVLAVASACTTGRARPAGSVASPIRHVLPNGVRVVVEEHRPSAVVAVQLWVEAGARDERPSELGVAHLLEHMLLKGTPTRPRGFIEREVEGVGGRMNAGTSLDYTYYRVLLPAPRALAGIEMLADLSVNASLDATELERERQVVLEEMRLGEDTPRRLLARRLYEALFNGHPYGRPVIGRPELIRDFTREQLLGFYRRHYVPEAFTLVVVGAVRPAEVLEVAGRTFGQLPRSGRSRLPVPVVVDPSFRHLDETRPGAHAYLAVGWLAPRLDHAETPAVDLLVSILGQGRSSRLTRRLREQLGLANWISASYAALEASGAVTLAAQVDAANLERTEAEILNQIRRLRGEGVLESERRRALTAAEARREFQRETVEGRANLLGHAETVWRIEDELAWDDRLRAVTSEQIRAAARRYPDPERYARVVFLPAAGR